MSKQPPNQTGNRLTRAKATAAPRSGSPDTPASGRRRSLLKAAASAAPVIATLPSGEALANASALQCVINEQNFTQTADVVSNDIADTYVRIDGYLVEDTEGNLIAYHITGAPFDLPSDIYVDINGNKLDPSELPADRSETATRFLRLYAASASPIGGAGDVAVADTGLPLPDNCEIKSGLSDWPVYPSAPDYCFYPITAERPPYETRGNVPLTTSCLTSFN